MPATAGAVEPPRRGEDAALGEPAQGIPARLFAGGPQIQPRLGVADGEARRAQRREQLLASARVPGPLLALVLVVVLFGAMLMLGNTIYPLSDVLAVLTGQKVPGASFAVGTLRLPRALTAVLAGIAFGVAGSTFQTMLRNPLASPDVIGITSGASAAAVLSLVVLHWSGAATMGLALLAGIVTAAIIYLAAITAISPSLYEAARIDGAGDWRILGTIVLPMSKAVTAVVARDNLVGTQFHPEKSGDAGAQLLRNWCDSL